MSNAEGHTFSCGKVREGKGFQPSPCLGYEIASLRERLLRRISSWSECPPPFNLFLQTLRKVSSPPRPILQGPAAAQSAVGRSQAKCPAEWQESTRTQQPREKQELLYSPVGRQY